jgi:hypothetical protein
MDQRTIEKFFSLVFDNPNTQDIAQSIIDKLTDFIEESMEKVFEQHDDSKNRRTFCPKCRAAGVDPECPAYIMTDSSGKRFYFGKCDIHGFFC